MTLTWTCERVSTGTTGSRKSDGLSTSISLWSSVIQQRLETEGGGRERADCTCKGWFCQHCSSTDLSAVPTSYKVCQHAVGMLMTSEEKTLVNEGPSLYHWTTTMLTDHTRSAPQVWLSSSIMCNSRLHCRRWLFECVEFTLHDGNSRLWSRLYFLQD